MVDDYCAHFTARDMLNQIQAGDMVIKSPGISYYLPIITALQAKGAIITSSLNLWRKLHPQPKLIGITGTKGKSTTASLLTHLLNKLGKSAVLAGNIGTPVFNLPPLTAEDIVVLELSSYQICTMDFQLDIGLLLNLYPEHIDWHGSHQQYYQDKLKLLSFSHTHICNAENPLTQTLVTQASRYFQHKQGFWADENGVWHQHNLVVAAADIPLKGVHNYINLAAVLSVIPDILEHDITKLLQGFTPLPHRLESIATIKGVEYVNDSIATTPETTIAALHVFKHQPVTLIIGGYDRKQAFTDLIPTITNLSVNVITVYETGMRLFHALTECHYKHLHQAHNLAEAIQLAQAITPENGVVLLSPAAPSYGAFQNFEERGNLFRNQVKNMMVE